MKKTRLMPIAIASALMLLMAGPAGAGATVTDVVAAATGSFVTVTGDASFTDQSVEVGFDGTGDTLVPGLGTDIGPGVHIARPNAGNSLRFTLDIADQPPVLFGTPELVHYDWEITVDNGGDTDGWRLSANRTAQNGQVGVNPVFILYKCAIDPQTGINNCTRNLPLLTGKIADGVVEWNVPLNRIGAQRGSVITSDAIDVSFGASRVLWGIPIVDSAFADGYTVPGPRVEVGIGAAGTPPELVAFTETATLSAGSFTAALPKPGEPGDYVVAARACYAANDCAVAGTTVTV